MKVVIQDCVTKEFLNPENKWCSDPEEARVFGSSVEAIKFCLEHHLTEVQLFLQFADGDPRLDLVVPVRECR